MNLTELLSQISRGQYEHDEDESCLEEFRFYFDDKVIVVNTTGTVELWDKWGENFVKNLA